MNRESNAGMACTPAAFIPCEKGERLRGKLEVAPTGLLETLEAGQPWTGFNKNHQKKAVLDRFLPRWPPQREGNSGSDSSSEAAIFDASQGFSCA